MKKNLLIGAFALLGFAASAQTEKGSWVVGDLHLLVLTMCQLK